MSKTLVIGWCVAMLAVGLAVVTPATAADGARRLGPCEGVRLKFAFSKRPHTVNDLMQSWIGSGVSEVVGQWGAPTSTFENRDGTRVISWRDEWSGCVKSFGVGTDDIVSKWGANNACSCATSKKGVPKGTPIPEMTL